MTARTNITWLALVAASLLIDPVATRASDPVGVYGMIDKVAITTAAGGAETAQIWGTFAVAVTPPSRAYTPEEAYGRVQKGYLLFTCADAKALCHAEWNDLQGLAGKDEVAGFGTRWGTAPRIRAITEAPSAPDTYRLNVGVVRIGRFGEYPTIVSALKAARAGH
jgi:hypothetical protein